MTHSLLLGYIYLEADDITILNLALGKSLLRLHELNHARLDFLQESNVFSTHTGLWGCQNAPRRVSMAFQA